jgi:hypothetical protein
VLACSAIAGVMPSLTADHAAEIAVRDREKTVKKASYEIVTGL